MSRLTLKLFPIGPLFAIAVGLGSSPSCQPAFPTDIATRALSVQITNGGLGLEDNRLPIQFTPPLVYTVSVTAMDENGDVDTTFNSYVRFSIQPGTVLSATSTSAGVTTNGRNALLVNGKVSDVQIAIEGAYGDARIWAEDLGYVPVDPAGVPVDGGGTRPPECANGLDDNHNGLVDYPVDPGCYAANDDTENGGTYAGAASGPIHFAYPRIPVVQGISNGGAGTPFPNEDVQIDTQWNGTTTNTPAGVVVVGVSATGFYATDVGWTEGYNSVYAYTYSAPPLMNVCDRLISFGGTSAEFYGFLELNYPTWSLEEWDPQARPCLVPEPATISVADLITSTSVETATLAPLQAALVRIPAPGETIHIAQKLGPNPIPYTMAANGTVTITLPITADATSCDYEGTGKIDYSNAAESACETACEDDPECSEYSEYASNSQFAIVMQNTATGSTTSITANGSASAGFNPITDRSKGLVAFTGTLNYFSGGNQYTIQARCSDDIVFDGGTVLPTSPAWSPDGGAQGAAACIVNLADQSTTN